MTHLQKLTKHDLITLLLDDDLKYEQSDAESELPTELEYYVKNCVFFIIHLASLTDQLENAVELLSNYNYKIQSKVGRGQHLTYSVENYIIRARSLADRLLQAVNAIYHLGVNEKDVTERSILNNIKVTQSNLPKYFKEFKNVLLKFTEDRNVIIHRHSYINNELFRIEKLYHPTLTEMLENGYDKEKFNSFKQSRKYTLTKYLEKTKKEFRTNNDMVFKSMIPVFDVLLERYESMKIRLA